MAEFISIKFSLNIIEFMSNLPEALKDHENVELINITQTPSTIKAYELLMQWWFKSNVFDRENLYAINFKIDKMIHDKCTIMPHFFELCNKATFLISFQSTIGGHESKIYWKVPGRKQFYSIFIGDDESEDLTKNLLEFLVEEIKNGRTGITENCRHKNQIHLQNIRDNNNNNLLILATRKLNSNVVKILLNHEFDADDAIDDAWEMFETHQDNNYINEIILSLLNSNSRLPFEFDYDKTSQEVKDFISMCESLHKDVDDEDFESLKMKLESAPNLVYFYNRKNESLLTHSLIMRKFDIYELLNKDISTGYHEDLDDVYANMRRQDKTKLRDQHKSNAKDYPEVHTLILKSKSKIGNNDRLAYRKWKYIDETYEILNSNNYCRKIMKVASKFKRIKIFFDFKHESTYYMDPASSYGSMGIIYEGGSIYIGAKGLLDEECKSEVFGVLAHELCHLAVLMSFTNHNFDPFPTGESELKRRFEDRVMAQCRQRQAFEWIIANVFTSYSKIIQDSEMIVTVPQMMMHYIHNEAKLEELEEVFEELFKYSREIVEPELDRAFRVLEQLENEIMALKFNNLTEPMKAAILHDEIKFNGSKTSFFELIGKDLNILQLLPSEVIKKYILKTKEIKIIDSTEPEFKYGVIERRFEELSKNTKNLKKSEKITKNKSLQTIQKTVNDSKIFILSDHAGTGKTTTFKHSANKLQKSSKNAFVAFINLRKYGKIFDNYKSKTESLTKQQVCDLLLEILNMKSAIEVEIFKKLFATGKVIFFFDGVDEVCPKYTNLLLKIFQILSEGEASNQQWISTRPHYSKKLQKLLNTTAHKFVPYTKEEKENFVKNILNVNKVYENQCESATKVVEYVKKLEGYYYESKEIDNPLMIQIIAELYIHGHIEFDTTNRIEIYEAMIEEQKKEVGDKVPISERDKDLKFSIWDVHRVFAFKLIFGNDYQKELKFNLNELPIFKKWQKERKHFTTDMIQRYGFMIVDLEDPKDDKSSIDFMHRTYAEYFIAKYLVDFIYDDDDSRSDVGEDLMKFKLFAVIIERPKKFKVMRDFIISYIKSQSDDKGVKSSFKSLIMQHLKKALNFKKPRFYEGFKATIENYADVAVLEPEIFKMLWKINESESTLKFIVFDKYTDHTEAIKLAFLSFGSNWHEKFNKSTKKLITDEEIEKLKDTNVDDSQWTEDKNFLKFYDFVDQNFSTDEKKTLYSRCQTSNFGKSSQIQIQIISRMRNIIKNQEFIDKFLINDFYKHRHASPEPVKFILDCIEEDNNYDRELMRKFLCQKCCEWQYPLVQGFRSNNSQILQLFKDLYLKYINSWEEIHDQLLGIEGCNYLQFTDSVTFNLHFMSLLSEIFNQNISKLAVIIEKWILRETFNITYSDISYSNMKVFLDFVFAHDKDKGVILLKKIVSKQRTQNNN